MSNKLSDIVDFNPSRILKKGTVAPFIEMASLPTNTKFIKQIDEKPFSGGSKFKNGDTLFARITPCLENGKTGKVTNLKDEMIGHGSTEFIVMSAKEPEFDEDYIYYFARLPEFREFAQQRMVGTSGRQRVAWQDLADFEFIFPPKEQRKKAAALLNIYDQKIDLNTQINQTLEQIAQALFKSWFVDFDPVRAKVQALSDGLSLEQAELAAMQAISGKTPEELTALSQTQPERYAELAETAKAFPCEMVEVDGVEVPKGWEYKSVGDFINVVDYVANGSFATLKENVTLLTEPDYAIYIRTTDFNSGFSKELRYVDKSAYDFLAKSVLIGNEVIISNVGDVGTVFRSPSWLGMPMTLGSNAIALKNYDIPHYLYLYFSSHKGQHDISSIVTGSAQLKFNKTNFRSLKVLMPNNSLLTKFEKFILPIFEKIDANMAENLKLAEIRDLLLPRLLSGDFL
jgi:hypothetical protein